MNIKFLLLQARHADDTARLEERQSFAELTGVSFENVIPHDLLSSAPTLAQVRRYDALMVGGSGEYYVSKANLPRFPAVLELLAEVAAVGHPLFASCFGFQLLVKALGGEIVYDPDGIEVGTFELALTDDGRADELFSTLPDRFRAQLGRKDRASRLPPGVLHLASSRFAPYQALRVPGQPIWATQFHPELTKEENLKRFRRYLDGYASTMSPEELQETLDRFDHSPEANELLRRFVKIVFE
ncbi:MAG: type 1 glutamine amidotransferase [Anaerolineae bacterium]